jgi:hypothetical protein
MHKLGKHVLSCFSPQSLQGSPLSQKRRFMEYLNPRTMFSSPSNLLAAKMRLLTLASWPIQRRLLNVHV